MLDDRSLPPLSAAFAHRDDEHPRPLLDALDHGFRFIEMDVWTVWGRTLVSHDMVDLRPWNTFEARYLRPLASWLEDRRRDPASASLGTADVVWLFVDVKTAAMPTFRAVERLAAKTSDALGLSGVPRERAPVQFVLSGNRPPYDVLLDERPICRMDGRFPDAGVRTDADAMPVISDQWTKHFAWRGEGPCPASDVEKLRTFVAKAHDHGQRVRFWDTPDRPGDARENVWSLLLDEGVDLINTDDLAGLAGFLRTRDAERPPQGA